MACLGIWFQRRSERNLVVTELLSGWSWDFLRPYQSWESSSKAGTGGTGSIAGREPEGQIKYLGRQDARLKRCQENQLDPKERAAKLTKNPILKGSWYFEASLLLLLYLYLANKITFVKQLKTRLGVTPGELRTDCVGPDYQGGDEMGQLWGAESDTRVIQLPSSSSPIDPFASVLLAHALETFSPEW